MITMTARQADALAIVATDFPDLLSAEGREVHDAAVAHRQAEERRRTEASMADQSAQMRRLGERAEAERLAREAEERRKAEAKAAAEEAERQSMVTLHHVDGWVREFSAGTAIRILEETPCPWSRTPWCDPEEVLLVPRPEPALVEKTRRPRRFAGVRG